MRVSRSRNNLNNINMLDFKVSDMGIAVCDNPTWSIERDSPQVSRLYFPLEGDTYVMTKDKTLSLEPGKCYLIPTGCSFKTGLTTHMKLMYFYFTISDNNRIDVLKKCEGVLEYTADPDTVQTLVSAIMSELLSSGLRVKCEILDTLLLLLKHNGVELEFTKYSPEVLTAIEYINSSLSVQLDVDEIAAKAHVSVSTLTKKFKNEIGMTVSVYIDRAIMKEAAFLLRYTDMTIQEISERFEFCYQSYFSKRFKDFHCITPQLYRGTKK